MGYLTTLSVSGLLASSGRVTSVELERILKEVSWRNRGTLPGFALKDWWRPRPTTVMIADVPVKIRTEYLPNTSPERYCYTNPFGYLRCDICSCYLQCLRKHTAISGLNDAACWLFSSLLSCLDLINWILYVSPHTMGPSCVQHDAISNCDIWSERGEINPATYVVIACSSAGNWILAWWW